MGHSIRVLPDGERPPPPPGVRYVRLPLIGALVADDALRQRVDRICFWPMIVLALLVLPILAIEHFYLSRDAALGASWLAWVCWWAMAIIWVAFLLEFLVKITIAENRFAYVQKNWLDVIIILLPALRPLRAASVARASRLLTLRGVGMKFGRYVLGGLLGLEVARRLVEKAEKRAEEMTRDELIEEIKRLRDLESRWAQWQEDWDQHQG